MRKLITIFILLFLIGKSYGQTYPLPYTNLGSINTTVRDTGGLFVRQTFVPPTYVDTNAANIMGYPAKYIGSQIFSKSDSSEYIWFGKWIKQASTGGSNPVTTIYNGNGTILSDRTVNGNGKHLDIQGLGHYESYVSSLTGNNTLEIDSQFIDLLDGVNHNEIYFDNTGISFNSVKGWQVNGDFGTSGYVLTSNGSTSPPTWSAPTSSLGLQNVINNNNILNQDNYINSTNHSLTLDSINDFTLNAQEVNVTSADVVSLTSGTSGGEISLTSPFGGIAIAANNSGSISLATVDGGINATTTGAGSINFNSANGVTFTTAGAIQFNNYHFPLSDGSTGQVLTTDGAGSVTWQTISSGSQNLQSVTDIGNTTTNSIVLSGAPSSYTLKNNTGEFQVISAVSNFQFLDNGIVSILGTIGDYALVPTDSTGISDTIPKANGVLALSVNGNHADERGNITISTGTTYSGTGYLKLSGTTPSYISSIPNIDLSHSSITLSSPFGVNYSGSGVVALGNTLTLTIDTTKLQTVFAGLDTANVLRNLINGKQGVLTLSTNNRGGLATLTGSALNIPNYFSATGDSASYINLPNETTLTPTPPSGVNMFDSSGRWSYRTSLGKTVSFSTNNISANSAIIDSFENKSGVLALLSDTVNSLYPRTSNPNGYLTSTTGQSNTAFTSGSVLFRGAAAISQDNANFFYDSTNHKLAIGTNTFDATNPEKLLVAAGTTTSVNAIHATGSINNYFQLNIQNQSSGTAASSDIVATENNGSETFNYLDMGINGSGYTGTTFGGAGNGYLYSSSNTLNLGTDSLLGHLGFWTNNVQRAEIDSLGHFGINTSIPTALLQLENDGLGAAIPDSSKGLLLRNNTAATSSVSQSSLFEYFQGHYWNTTSGTSNITSWKIGDSSLNSANMNGASHLITQGWTGTQYATAIDLTTQSGNAFLLTLPPATILATNTIEAATGSIVSVNGGIYQTTTAVNSFLGAMAFGINPASINSSAELDLSNITTKGVLLPKLTTTQMNAISSPATGLMVYNTTIGQNYRYSGTSWLPEQIGGVNPTIAAGAGSGTGSSVSVTGNNTDGIITVTSGTLPTASAVIATITLGGSQSYPTSATMTLTPNNANAALLSGASMVYVTGTGTTTVLNSGTTNITGSLLYSWTYHIGGY
jgi:hypothetical protein